MISPASKLVLIPDTRSGAQSPGVRRYRLVRLALNPERTSGAEPFSHLKRCYD